MWPPRPSAAMVLQCLEVVLVKMDMESPARLTPFCWKKSRGVQTGMSIILAKKMIRMNSLNDLHLDFLNVYI